MIGEQTAHPHRNQYRSSKSGKEFIGKKCSTEKLRKQDSSSILRGESYRRYGRGRNCGRKREREGVDQPHPSSVQPVDGAAAPSGGQQTASATKIWGNYERKTEVCCFRAGVTSAVVPPPHGRAPRFSLSAPPGNWLRLPRREEYEPKTKA